MNLAAITPVQGALSPSQREALLKLLADEDQDVFAFVRSTLVAQGPISVEWLKPYASSEEPLLRRRARSIITHFQRHQADTEFLAFCLNSGREFDIEEAAWLLAKTRYPEINDLGYRAILDDYAGRLRQRTDDRRSRDALVELNNVLFDDLGYAGNEENYYDPDNSYLNKVVDRRTGNPINLCLLYLLVGRRLGLPVAGIGLPGHFVCRFQSTSTEIYVDVFNRGKFLTKSDCIHYLLQGNYSLKDDFLAPVSARKMMLRICGNLHQIYLHLENAEEATRLQRYLVALSK